MGQKINPIGFRLGVVKGWDSSWFGSKKANDYSLKLIEDERIRKYLLARVPKGGVAKIVIERTLDKVVVVIHTSRPGHVIGKGGQEVDKIKASLEKLIKKNVHINIFEIKKPELDATLIGETVARQLELRSPFRRAMKLPIATAMRMGAEGVKIAVSGRIGGAEMARTEKYQEGRVPLHTLRSDISYALVEAQTAYGKLGVKVWVCQGEVYGKRVSGSLSGSKRIDVQQDFNTNSNKKPFFKESSGRKAGVNPKKRKNVPPSK
ncbi:MAG: 30S ribosomal protein S3 [Solitalea-like symbiont of Acarus siro]